MPLPLEKIQVVDVQMERDADHMKSSPVTYSRMEHEFSFLNQLAMKRSVHYDIESIDDDYGQPLRSVEPPSPMETVLRRRYIAHWGLPGKATSSAELERNNSFLFSSFVFSLEKEWLGDNHFLLQKHRPPTNSVRECLLSMGSIHSETVNIWTHFIGALCVALTFILFLLENYRQMDLSDFISFSVFFISAILCLTFSTLLHIFINYSPDVLITVSKLDYLGKSKSGASTEELRLISGMNALLVDHEDSLLRVKKRNSDEFDELEKFD